MSLSDLPVICGHCHEPLRVQTRVEWHQLENPYELTPTLRSRFLERETGKPHFIDGVCGVVVGLGRLQEAEAKDG